MPAPPFRELRIFVYGTLKKNFVNHGLCCRGVVCIRPAAIIGKLYKLTPDIPVMTVPDAFILARGSPDVHRDLLAQEHWNVSTACRNETDKVRRLPGSGSWSTVRGEVHVFDDPFTRLPFLDAFEEFRPGEVSPYVRVLVRARLKSGACTSAWTYIAGCKVDGLEEYAGEEWYPD